MQVSRNEKLIRTRARLGTYATLGGLAVLVIGMIASFQQQFIWVSFAALLTGFLLAQFGGYNLRRWGRSPRPDQVLETALKGFDDRYRLYSWVLPVPHALLSPQGLYCFTPRDQTGPITVNGSQWRSKLTLGKVLMAFAQEGLGNPTSEAINQAEQLATWIKKQQPDFQPKVQPVVVFIDERAQLTINEPTVPVLDAKGLKKWLRGAGKGDTLKPAEYKTLEELFEARSE
jgi:hypothetical protein